MPFVASVLTTEYISAVNRAPVSLSEPKESRLPMTGPLSALSAALSRIMDYSGIVPGTGGARGIECKMPE